MVIENKTEVPNEWYTCKVLKNKYIVFVGTKKIFSSEESQSPE
jgi:hypothetical protein